MWFKLQLVLFLLLQQSGGGEISLFKFAQLLTLFKLGCMLVYQLLNALVAVSLTTGELG
jgi:hypothetical protein